MNTPNNMPQRPYAGGRVLNFAGAIFAEVSYVADCLHDSFSPDPNSVAGQHPPRNAPGLRDVIFAEKARRQYRKEERAAWRNAENISSGNVH